jgi:hypothetical protein
LRESDEKLLRMASISGKGTPGEGGVRTQRRIDWLT